MALHVAGSGTYRLSKPFDDGHQFLVIHSGRQYAFTTLEVLPERPSVLVDRFANVFDPSAPGGQRPFRYEGVLVSRYDQTRGTGTQARFGPALHDTRNPEVNYDAGWGRDDYSVIGDGESRDIGGGVTVSVSRNGDGSFDVAVGGGKMAAFEPWCYPIWFSKLTMYDTGCLLDDGEQDTSEPPEEPDTGTDPPDPPDPPDAPDDPVVTFRDCPECPSMVTIPPGSFTMGMSDSEFNSFFTGPNFNGPPHRVDIGYRFCGGRARGDVRRVGSLPAMWIHQAS